MKSAILSRAPRAYSTLRLKAAAMQRGHEVKVLNALRFERVGGAPVVIKASSV